jgi:hypothetical protein
MERYLMMLIDEAKRAGDETALVQLRFKPGLQMQAGALKNGPIQGMFQLVTMAMATKDTPGGFKPGDQILCTMTFAADAVQEVFTFVRHEGGRIVAPSGVLGPMRSA